MKHYNCKIKYTALLFFLLPAVKLAAQFDVFPGSKRDSAKYNSYHVLVDHEVDTSGKIPKFGPNRLFFVTFYSHLGALPGPQVYGAQTNWWSYSLAYGVRMKLKFFSWNSLVWDIGYRCDRFSIRQKVPKLYPLTTDNHVRERISLHNFSFTLCDRINFGKRGNVLGNWLDFGVYGDYIFRSANVFLDQHYDSNGTQGHNFRVRTSIIGLPYVEKMNYGITVRAGGEITSVFIQYRVNKLFSVETPNDRDLSRIIVGIGFSGWD
jgi:hypothetical protein